MGALNLMSATSGGHAGRRSRRQFCVLSTARRSLRGKFTAIMSSNSEQSAFRLLRPARVGPPDGRLSGLGLETQCFPTQCCDVVEPALHCPLHEGPCRVVSGQVVTPPLATAQEAPAEEAEVGVKRKRPAEDEDKEVVDDANSAECQKKGAKLHGEQQPHKVQRRSCRRRAAAAQPTQRTSRHAILATLHACPDLMGAQPFGSGLGI